MIARDCHHEQINADINYQAYSMFSFQRVGDLIWAAVVVRELACATPVWTPSPMCRNAGAIFSI